MDCGEEARPYRRVMSETDSEREPGPGEITDDQLPEDVRPGEDNPLAEPLDPDDEATKSSEELGMRDTQDSSEDDGETSGTSSEESTEDDES